MQTYIPLSSLLRISRCFNRTQLLLTLIRFQFGNYFIFFIWVLFYYFENCVVNFDLDAWVFWGLVKLVIGFGGIDVCVVVVVMLDRGGWVEGAG